MHSSKRPNHLYRFLAITSYAAFLKGAGITMKIYNNFQNPPNSFNTFNAAEDFVYSSPSSRRIKEPNLSVGRLNRLRIFLPASDCNGANLKIPPGSLASMKRTERLHRLQTPSNSTTGCFSLILFNGRVSTGFQIFQDIIAAKSLYVAAR